MPAYAFSKKSEAAKFAANKNKTVTKKYHWIVKPLSTGYVVMRRLANVKPSQVKNIKLSSK